MLGSQGDVWDAQKDMLADLLGAVFATGLFGLAYRRHPAFRSLGSGAGTGTSAAVCLAGLALLAVTSGTAQGADAAAAAERRLSLADYRDHLKAGWVGQMAGVAWGAPTEFRWKDEIIPAAAMPAWTPGMVNDSFGQDDLYVEMTFLRTLEEHGLDVSLRQAGIDFANSRYPLWCANDAGRRNLRRGIAPPDSGHPRYNRCPNDIDYQIEADYSGLIAPGLPQVAIRMGETFGRMMNYGDGVDAGQFIGALYAGAFLETDIERLVTMALTAIPAASQYAEMVRDLLAWHRAHPDNWEQTWTLAHEKYRRNPDYQRASNGSIDCKINGACVLIGLLYGAGDPDRTIILACRGGQDSDCNPSSAAGVLFTTLGWSRLPARFTQALDEKRVFSHTAYSFPALLAVCEQLARQLVVRAGGRIEKDDAGQEVFVIPVQSPQPGPLRLSWDPEPAANSRFSDAERALITEPDLPAGMLDAVAACAPGWEIRDCGPDMQPGLRPEYAGRKQVLMTHPLDQQTGCILARKVPVPAAGKTVLHLVVGHDDRGDFELVVRLDGREALRTVVGPQTATAQWLTRDLDLTPDAGKTVAIELENRPNGWSWEAAYWAEIRVDHAAP